MRSRCFAKKDPTPTFVCLNVNPYRDETSNPGSVRAASPRGLAHGRLARLVARHHCRKQVRCMPARAALTPPPSIEVCCIGVTATACGPSDALFAALQQRYTSGTHLFMSWLLMDYDAVTDVTRFWATRP